MCFHIEAPTFDCSIANLHITGGFTGAPVIGNATVDEGTVISIDPENYLFQTNTYTASILVPDGYSNEGEIIECTDSAYGRPVKT